MREADDLDSWPRWSSSEGLYCPAIGRAVLGAADDVLAEDDAAVAVVADLSSMVSGLLIVLVFP